MAVRLEAVAERRMETTRSLEHARPVEPGGTLIGWVLVLVVAVLPVGLWLSFGHTGRLVEMIQAYWRMI